MSLHEPETDESRLAAATWDLPKAQRYALRVIWAEIIRKGHCSMLLDEISESAGVCRNCVIAALKAAQALGFINVTERRFQTAPNASNVVRLARVARIGKSSRTAARLLHAVLPTQNSLRVSRRMKRRKKRSWLAAREFAKRSP